MSLVEIPTLPCPVAFEEGGVEKLSFFTTRSVFVLPTCCGTQESGQSVLLKSGSAVYTVEFDDETVRYNYGHQSTAHGAYLAHEITATRKGITPAIDQYLAILPHDHWIAVAKMNDGRNRLIGSLIYPLRFRGAGDYPPQSDQAPFSSWRFYGVSRHPFCFITQPDVLVIDCASLSDADFVVYDWDVDSAGLITGIPAPQPDPTRLISTIIDFDDGVLVDAAGNGVDGITYNSVSGKYEPDSAPVTLAPGTYTASFPMSVELVDGTSCGYLLQQQFKIETTVESGIFDPQFFDTQYFK